MVRTIHNAELCVCLYCMYDGCVLYTYNVDMAVS